MRPIAAALLAVLLAVPGAAAAQDATADPLTGAARQQFSMVKNYIVKSAEKMPEDQFGFQPSPDVRSFGALLGHIANANFMICSRAAGEASPSQENIEKTKTTKADLVKALNAAFAYCDGVFAKMGDKAGSEAIDFFGGKQPKLSVLTFNTAHNFEHYGNLITYMRIKGVVPPSSEGRM
jgi:uncharacterized damage-inducible protein DinB